MSERRGDEQRKIARRVKELGKYCDGDELSLEGLQERIAGIPPDAVQRSKFFLRACGNERVTLEVIECLLDAFPEAARSIDECEQSPLHFACKNKNPDPRIVRVLLDLWPESANHRSDAGSLPLHKLCKNRSADETAQLAILNLLLNAVPDSVTIVNVNDMGNLPIHIAGNRGKPLSFCKRLIDAYPESLRVQTMDGCLPIHIACGRGNVETVKYMHELYPESIDARDRDGNLPIHWAASSKGQHKVDIIRYLLSKDPDCASKTGGGERLPLHVACWNNSFDSARLLFDAYPEAIDSRDEDGRTPLVVTTSYRISFAGETPLDVTREPELRGFLEAQLAYARLAEDATAMTTPDQHGWLPLHRALLTGACLGAIKLLIAGNPSALQVAVNQLAFPLHIACEFSTAEVVRHLLGLLDNHLQKDSTLHYAIRGGNLGAVNCLLEKGVPSVSEPDSDGKLPVQLLWESDRVDHDSVEYVEANWRFLLAYPEMMTL